MENKFALVTGTSSGLGNAIALKLANSDYIVFAGVRKNEDAQKLSSLNKNIIPIILDITDEYSVEEAFKEIKQKTDTIDVLVNNAGVALAGPVEYLTAEILKKQFDVNVFGAIRVAQKTMAFMQKVKDARIINISSMASYAVFPFISPYCASKRALDIFFNSLLLETKLKNLKIVSIKPGVVCTPIWNKSVSESKKNLEFLCQEGKEKYNKEFDFLLANAEKNNDKGINPQEVADLVLKILKIKNPKLSYNIGKDSYFARVLSFLPQKLLNFLVKCSLQKKIGC